MDTLFCMEALEEALIKYPSEEKLKQSLKDLNLEVVTQLNIIKYKQELEKKLNTK